MQESIYTTTSGRVLNIEDQHHHSGLSDTTYSDIQAVWLDSAAKRSRGCMCCLVLSKLIGDGIITLSRVVNSVTIFALRKMPYTSREIPRANIKYRLQESIASRASLAAFFNFSRVAFVVFFRLRWVSSFFTALSHASERRPNSSSAGGFDAAHFIFEPLAW